MTSRGCCTTRRAKSAWRSTTGQETGPTISSDGLFPIPKPKTFPGVERSFLRQSPPGPVLIDSLCFSTAVQDQRALPTETKVESGTSQSKSETSVNLIKSGLLHSVAPPGMPGFG